MLIPKIDICPADLIKRYDVVSTAESFKHWNTCMDNKTCKIVAIIGIVLAALVVFWIISTLVRCCCMGLSCIEALCCCCGGGGRRGYNEKQQVYNNPNMYGPNQTVYAPSHRGNHY